MYCQKFAVRSNRMALKECIALDTIKFMSTKTNLHYQLHFNLWNSDDNKIKALDVGVMCPIAGDNHVVSLIIPGDYSKDNVVCLNKKLHDSDTIDNIFNAHVSWIKETDDFKIAEIDKSPKPNLIFAISNFHNKKDKDEKDELLIPLKEQSKSQKISQEIKNQNLVIHFEVAKKIDASVKKEAVTEYYEYFRIRINKFDLARFSIIVESKPNFVVPSYEKNVVLEFRVNDRKLMSSDDRKEMDEHKVYFDKIHFLLINDIPCKTMITDASAKIRLFENNKWKEYLCGEEIKKPMLAYHLSKKSEENQKIEMSSFLIKFQEKKMAKCQVGLYVIVAFLLGLLGSLCSDIFKSLFS